MVLTLGLGSLPILLGINSSEASILNYRNAQRDNTAAMGIKGASYLPNLSTI
jgi:hypothetical protein